VGEALGEEKFTSNLASAKEAPEARYANACVSICRDPNKEFLP
jgi:hypothetical protein